jgi:hypothetical protein
VGSGTQPPKQVGTGRKHGVNTSPFLPLLPTSYPAALYFYHSKAKDEMGTLLELNVLDFHLRDLHLPKLQASLVPTSTLERRFALRTERRSVASHQSDANASRDSAKSKFFR